jgi:hypothetical protein
MSLVVIGEILFLSINGKSKICMKATERLKLMQQIAQKLGDENWNIVNLTLEQFRLPVSRSSRLKSTDYILKKIANAGNDVLQDLARHLEIPLSGVTVTENPSFWKNGNLRLFISHLARKKESAGALREELEPMGISAFVAHNDIAPSKEWEREIETALGTCDALVALMEEGFHRSFWTDHEVGFAFGRSLPIIPVNMGEDPYGFIARFQAYKFQDIPTLAETIFKLLLNDVRTSRKMSEVLVHRFENSNTFASANVNLKHLRKIRCWDPGLLERVRLSVKRNDQIRGSFDVPEGVTRLLKKVKSKMIEMNDISA